MPHTKMYAKHKDVCHTQRCMPHTKMYGTHMARCVTWPLECVCWCFNRPHPYHVSFLFVCVYPVLCPGVIGCVRTLCGMCIVVDVAAEETSFIVCKSLNNNVCMCKSQVMERAASVRILLP
eukprot:GHVR01150202.1.p2 GENE.GHVR01150202.1~~GHVR01150202.1.p2  ORF type:complete len:121 (-),score=18.31 GHVR01150202.1:1767-2129(-)